jgi:4-hydroxy-3-polyprenylbenzoate decarboxylase
MIITAISGASGSILGIRLIEELLLSGEKVTGIVSDSSWQIIGHELSWKKMGPEPLKTFLKQRGIACALENFQEYANDDFFSPAASGSSGFDAVVVIPCSMKTLSAIAHGYADNLINRVCDVALKEGRRCIVVPRETPLSVIHLENMLTAARSGVQIVPPSPGFYTLPESVEDIVNFIVGKVLHLLGKKHHLFKAWGDTPNTSDAVT